MATQMLYAREGKITDQVKIAAEREHMEPEKLRQLIGQNTVFLANQPFSIIFAFKTWKEVEWYPDFSIALASDISKGILA